MVRFRPIPGRRVVILLTALVGVLSLITGVLNLATTVPLGIVEPIVPDIVTEGAGFTGAMTGFILLTCAYLLQQGRRVGWYGALLLLPLSAIQGFVQASVLSIPLIVLSLLAMPAVAANRSAFTRPTTLDATQVGALTAVVGAFAYGTFGAFALREQYGNIDTLLDAFYYTVITATTVGYGDAVPQTQFARLFGISVVVLATASFAVALGTLLAPALEARLASAMGKITESELEALEDHVVILGVGDLTDSLVNNFPPDTDYIVIEDRPDIVSRLNARGVLVLDASGTDDAPLQRAQIDRARAVVVATENDANDVLAILTVRAAAPSVRIVAAATNTDNVAKMKQAGADVVISPATIGGRILGDAALSDDDNVDVDAVLTDLLRES